MASGAINSGGVLWILSVMMAIARLSCCSSFHPQQIILVAAGPIVPEHFKKQRMFGSTQIDSILYIIKSVKDLERLEKMEPVGKSWWMSCLKFTTCKNFPVQVHRGPLLHVIPTWSSWSWHIGLILRQCDSGEEHFGKCSWNKSFYLIIQKNLDFERWTFVLLVPS